MQDSQDDGKKSIAESMIPPIESNNELDELKHLLDFIQLNESASSFFDKNGSRMIYQKFRQGETPERNLHSIVHFFISMHLPLISPQSISPASKTTAESLNQDQKPLLKKSNLKPSSQIDAYKA